MNIGDLILVERDFVLENRIISKNSILKYRGSVLRIPHVGDTPINFRELEVIFKTVPDNVITYMKGAIIYIRNEEIDLGIRSANFYILPEDSRLRILEGDLIKLHGHPNNISLETRQLNISDCYSVKAKIDAYRLRIGKGEHNLVDTELLSSLYRNSGLMMPTSVSQYLINRTLLVDVRDTRFTGYRSNTDSFLFNDTSKNKRNTTIKNNNSLFDCKEIIKIFKYIPIKIGSMKGFYDPKTSKLVSYHEDYEGRETYDISHTKLNEELATHLYGPLLFDKCTFKVKNYIKSKDLFSMGSLKKELVGTIVEVTDLVLGDSVKKSNILENTIYVITKEGKKLRFSLDDIEIIYPNISGYSPKVNRKISVGHHVRVINDKHMTHLKKNDIIQVDNIKSIGKQKYVGYKVNGDYKYERLNRFKKYVKASKSTKEIS